MLLTAHERTEHDDSELLELFRRTERGEYLGELYNRYMPLVYGLCLKYLKSVEAAEDAVMQIYETLGGKILRHEIREFRTWLYSVARNHCLQILRKANPERATDFSTMIVEADDDNPFDRRQEELRTGALERCLEQLPVPQRESVRLFFLEERSYAEVAEITSYHLKSVKSYIQNGKRNLKICLEKHGIKA